MIVGGGPAGLLYSLHTSSPAIILEEHERPGRPPHCTGLVSASTALRLARYAPEAIARDYQRIVFSTTSRTILEIGPIKGLAYRVERPLLEDILWDEAASRGVDLLPRTRATGLEKDCVMAGERKYCGEYIVIAAGPSQGISPRRHRPLVLPGVQVPAYSSRRLCEDCFEVILDRRVSPEMFGWIVPLDERRMLIGTASRKAVHMRLRFLVSLAEQRLGPLRLGKTMGGTILRGPPRREIVEDRVIYLGDSAATSKPYTGGGLYAIALLAPLAGEAVERGDLNLLRRRYKGIRRQLVAQHLLTKTSEALGPEHVSSILEAVWRTGAGNELALRTGYDAHERSLLVASRHAPGILAQLLRQLISMPDSNNNLER